MLNILPGLTSCTNCELHKNGFVIPGQGPVPAVVMALGEAPGEDEAGDGRPFIGKAGRELDKLLASAGWDREDVYCTNTVKHHPGKGNPTPKVLYQRACRQWLEMEILQVNPDYIICLGATAINAILGKVDMPKYHGIGLVREIMGRERVVIPMYHPAAGMHNPELAPVIKQDFRKLSTGVTVATTPQRTGVKPGVDINSASYVAIDLETTSLDTKTTDVVAYVMAVPEGEYANNNLLDMRYVLRYWCVQRQEEKRLLIFHNVAFDVPIMNRGSIDKIDISKTWDTMLSGYVLGYEPLGLKARALRELGIDMPSYEEIGGGEKDASKIPWDKLKPYVALDGYTTRLLYEKDEPAIRAAKAEQVFQVEMSLVQPLLDMSDAGMLIDPNYLDQLSVELTLKMEDCKDYINTHALEKVNLNSPQQLGHLLFDVMGLHPLKKTKSKTAWAVDDETLVKLEPQHPEFIGRIREFKKLAKIKGTYAEGLLKQRDADNYVHSTLRQTGAGTGRISSAAPNLQNQPSRSELGRRIREAFIAPEGKVLLSADYVQVELVTAAALSHDSNMIRVFAEGGDIHQATADLLGVSRSLAKNLNFGMLYRLSASGLQRYLASEATPPVYLSIKECNDIITAFLGAYPDLMLWQDKIINNALADGYVSTVLNRRRQFPYIQDATGAVLEDMKKAIVNVPEQGSAADIIKTAMVVLSTDLTPGVMRMQVHDELLFYVNPKELLTTASFIKGVMCKAGTNILGIPVNVSLKAGLNWGNLTEDYMGLDVLKNVV